MTVGAYQNNSFQNDAFQITPSFAVDAFQKCAFQFGAFQTSECPTPTTQERSGWWRLQLYKLQEEALAKRQEKAKDEIAEAVAKVVEPPKKAKTQSKPVTRKPVETPRVSPEPVKPRLKSVIPVPKTEVVTTLPLMLQVWSIMTETHLMLLGGVPVIEMLKAQIDAANDEEDIELLLLAA